MPTLTLPGELASLDAIGDFVIEQARLAGLGKHATYQLQLAVDELATNSITYGYQNNGLSGDVVISADLDDHALTVVLEDCAPPFDPLQQDMEQVEEHFDKPLDDRPIGGLGIFFVRKAVDDFRYERRDDRNRNILTVYRTEAGQIVPTGHEVRTSS
jgi:anti-sigma regulatory factor (Ser/Thr protein kinase)